MPDAQSRNPGSESIHEPLVSVVTVHLHDFSGLERTMESLQKSVDRSQMEWVVVDGASTPSTAEERSIMQAVAVAADRYVSEKDRGIYDAMNKGVRLSRGTLLLFLNAGDEWHERFSLGQVRRLVDQGNPGMIWGACLEQRAGAQGVLIKPRRPGWAWYGMPAYHPAIFFRRELLGAEPFDMRFDIAADYELVCRLLKSGAGVERLQMVVSRFHVGGISDTGHERLIREETLIRQRHWNLPTWISSALGALKRRLKRLSRYTRLRSAWRKWV